MPTTKTGPCWNRTWPGPHAPAGWPSPRPVIDAGVRAVFGFPLRVGAVRLGALNLYRDQPGPLADEQHADALVLADVAAELILMLQAHAPPGCSQPRWRPAQTSSTSSTRPPACSQPSSRSASPTRSSG